MSLTILRAAIHRTGDVGIDLPAGASAGSLQPTDYHLIDMEPEEPFRSRVMGVDLPAGASASDLRPEDYQPWVTDVVKAFPKLHDATAAPKSAPAALPKAATTSAR